MAMEAGRPGSKEAWKQGGLLVMAMSRLTGRENCSLCPHGSPRPTPQPTSTAFGGD